MNSGRRLVKHQIHESEKMRNSKTPKQQHCLDMCWRLTDMLNRNWRIANGYDSNDFSKCKFTLLLKITIKDTL